MGTKPPSRPLPQPSASLAVSADVVAAGPAIPAIDRIKLFSERQWEEFVLEWADSLRTIYQRVERCGGSGDMGRDVIAFCNAPSTDWDNYQCKHYGGALAPSDIWGAAARRRGGGHLRDGGCARGVRHNTTADTRAQASGSSQENLSGAFVVPAEPLPSSSRPPLLESLPPPLRHTGNRRHRQLGWWFLSCGARVKLLLLRCAVTHAPCVDLFVRPGRRPVDFVSRHPIVRTAREAPIADGRIK